MKKLFALLFAISVCLLIVIFSIIKKTAHDTHLLQATKMYTKAYNTVYDDVHRLADALMANFQNQGYLTEVMYKVSLASDEQKVELRKKLTKTLTPVYERLKTFNVRQFHIHLPNNESFLRMHRPLKFGDNLTNFRPTVTFVNEHKMSINGFEEGRIYNGYRFVYPLFTRNGIHLGSVEISFGAQVITSSIMKHYGVLSNFFIKKSVVEGKVFSDEKGNYEDSNHEGFLYDKLVLKEVKNISGRSVAKLIPMKETTSKVRIAGLQDKPSSIYDKKIGSIFTVIPIKNPVSKNPVAFLTIRSKAENLQVIDNYLTGLFVLSILVVFLLLYFYYLQLQKREFLQKLFDTDDSLLVLINEKGVVRLNQAALDFFRYESLEDFKKEHKCVCEFFVKSKEEGYLYVEDIKGWKELLNGKDKISGFVRAKTDKNKTQTFSITVSKLSKNNLYLVLHSITEFKNLEEKLRLANEQLDLAIQGANDGLWDWNVSSNEVFLSKRAQEILGLEKETLHVNVLNDLLYLENGGKLFDDFEEYFRNKDDIFSKEYTLEISEKKVWILLKGKAIFDINHKPLRMVGFITDITDNKLAIESLKENEASFRRLFDNNSTMMLLINPQTGAIVDANGASVDFYGYPKDVLLNKNINEINTLSKEELQKRMLDAVVKKKGYFIFEHRLASGEIRDVEVYTSLIWYQKHLVLFSLIFDITVKKQIQLQLELAESVFVHTQEAIVITDKEGKILRVNPSFEKMTGFNEKELVDQNPRILQSSQHDACFYEDMWKNLVENGSWSGEVWNSRKNGNTYPSKLNINAVKNENNEVVYYVGLSVDITKSKEYEQKLENAAYYDSLTSLPNRVFLNDRLSNAMVQAKRREEMIVVAYVDFDGFKEVNDTYGHNAGDFLLKTLSKNMQKSLRQSDTIARIGGDEFIIVLVGLKDVNESIITLDRIIDIASTVVTFQGDNLKVGASIGVTSYPQKEEIEGEGLLRQADQAMYVAKKSGKNRYSFFDSKTN